MACMIFYATAGFVEVGGTSDVASLVVRDWVHVTDDSAPRPAPAAAVPPHPDSLTEGERATVEYHERRLASRESAELFAGLSRRERRRPSPGHYPPPRRVARSWQLLRR